jgi:hypothetical protein
MSAGKKHEKDNDDRLAEKAHDHVHGPGCACGGHHHGGSANQGEHPQRELPDFPTEVTFKAVFRNTPFTLDAIRNICAEAELDIEISDRSSRNAKFISYTLTGIFPSDDVLKSVCGKVGALEGFVTMF